MRTRQSINRITHILVIILIIISVIGLFYIPNTSASDPSLIESSHNSTAGATSLNIYMTNPISANLYVLTGSTGNTGTCQSFTVYATNNVTNSANFNQSQCTTGSAWVPGTAIFYFAGNIPSSMKTVHVSSSLSAPLDFTLSVWSGFKTSATPTSGNIGTQSFCSGETSIGTSFSALNDKIFIEAVTWSWASCSTQVLVSGVTGTGGTPHNIFGASSSCSGGGSATVCQAQGYIGTAGTSFGFTIAASPTHARSAAYIIFTGFSPPVVTTTGTTLVTNTSARFSGLLNSVGSTPFQTCTGFIWGLGNSTYDHNTTFLYCFTIDNETFTFDASNLIPGRTYCYKAYAAFYIGGDPTNSSNYNNYVIDSTACFMTTFTAPTVITLSAIYIGYNDAYLRGQITSLGTPGNITYGFLFANNSAFTIGQKNFTVGVTTHILSYNFKATNLTENRTYFFRAWIIIYGKVFYGGVLNFTTIQHTPLVIDGIPASNLFFLLVFVTVIILFFIGIFWVRRHRGMFG